MSEAQVIPFRRTKQERGVVFLSPEQLAERWGFHVETIYRKKDLPFVRIGRSRRYRLSDVERYELDHEAFG